MKKEIPLHTLLKEPFNEEKFHEYFGDYPFTHTLDKYHASSNDIINNEDIQQHILSKCEGDELVLVLLEYENLIMVNSEFAIKTYLTISKHKTKDFYVANILKSGESELFENVLPTFYFKYIHEFNYYIDCYNNIFNTNEYYVETE